MKWMSQEPIIQHEVCQKEKDKYHIQMHIKTIPMEKKSQKAKWLSEEASQIAEKRREVKGKGEKETCPSECRVPKEQQ